MSVVGMCKGQTLADAANSISNADSSLARMTVGVRAGADCHPIVTRVPLVFDKGLRLDSTSALFLRFKH